MPRRPKWSMCRPHAEVTSLTTTFPLECHRDRLSAQRVIVPRGGTRLAPCALTLQSLSTTPWYDMSTRNHATWLDQSVPTWPDRVLIVHDVFVRCTTTPRGKTILVPRGRTESPILVSIIPLQFVDVFRADLTLASRVERHNGLPLSPRSLGWSSLGPFQQSGL